MVTKNMSQAMSKKSCGKIYTFDRSLEKATPGEVCAFAERVKRTDFEIDQQEEQECLRGVRT
jgi:hypothetical protein